MMPPPPFRFSLTRNDFTLDPALDDTALAAARDAMALGRWSQARALLAKTGDDWDLRGHRLVVLGEVAANGWAQDWLLAEPDSVDAATLHAFASVLLAARGRGRPEPAREACLAAARLVPADPSPWLAMLILARYTGTDDERMRAFDQVRGRHREHHHAHHLMAACLAERQKGDGDDPFHEVYEFAEWAAGEAPPGSPLAVLPVVAHVERYRVLAEAGHEPHNPANSDQWTSWRAGHAHAAAFSWWLDWDGRDHPRLKVDLNFLAYAKFHEGRMAEAAGLFGSIGRNATRIPWSYPGRDPEKAFRAARTTAVGLGAAGA
ncbi:hypothetical protein AQ490_24160 [Wenjunlia vitaminophila]|uniref:Tetratricopeptide repeat protein n=2 Tax=Wenjunlia vitaminophila TaxID=76728 RepID=A0A0T6LRX4_WENVI|nr:hypothetical protein AQ490_24160 [Wenjunlia vitaminophila]